MDSAAKDNFDRWEINQWSELMETDEDTKQVGRNKKRRRPLRRNRKPTRPANYIGQRNNNRLLKICPKKDLE